MSRARVRTLRATAVLAAACVLAACTGSGDELDVEGFAEGACTQIADTAQEVDEVLRQVVDEQIEPDEAGDRLRQAQEELKPAREDAEQPVSTAITELLTRMGFFRISVDSNSYDGSQVQDVRTALEDLAQECRGG